MASLRFHRMALAGSHVIYLEPGRKQQCLRKLQCVLPRPLSLRRALRCWNWARTSGLLQHRPHSLLVRIRARPGVRNRAGIGVPVSISVAARVVAIAGRNAVAVSVSGGESWLPTKTLDADFSINSVAVDNSGDVWLAARTGLFRSTDAGDSWKKVSSLRLADIQTVHFDDENHRVLVTSGMSMNIFESADNGRTWNAITAGWRVRNLRVAHGRLVGTTTFDGVVVQPEITVAAENVSGSGTR